MPVRELFGMTEIGIGTLVPLDATDMVGRDSCGIIAPSPIPTMAALSVTADTL